MKAIKQTNELQANNQEYDCVSSWKLSRLLDNSGQGSVSIYPYLGADDSASRNKFTLIYDYFWHLNWVADSQYGGV